MAAKPIPAFYCCYLLRSTVRHGSVYVGSTPDPVRRLGQHNGLYKGGAARTSKLSLRPWEMICIVSGFKSQVAALQFEWSFQNCHLTRHIPSEERISFPTTQIRTSSKTGRTRKKPGRPRTSLKDKLANLHLLLRADYFSKWPLQVRFFNEEAYEIWQKFCKEAKETIREGIPIILDIKQADAEENEAAAQKKKRRKSDDFGKGGIQGLDVTYSSYQDVLEKSRFLIVDGESLQCSICQNPLVWDQDLITTCSGTDCNALSHVSCLSKHFLQGKDPSVVVPDHGNCPSCKTSLQWQDLMTEMTLRLRAPKEIQKILRKKKRVVAGIPIDVPDEREDGALVDDQDESLTAEAVARLGEDFVGEDYDDDEAETEAEDATSATIESAFPSSLKHSPSRTKRFPSVIDESDWEGAELIE